MPIIQISFGVTATGLEMITTGDLKNSELGFTMKALLRVLLSQMTAGVVPVVNTGTFYRALMGIIRRLYKSKWENAFTLDKASWGLRREAQVGDYLSIHEVIQTIAETVRY
jgi:hypothetical protein